MATTPKSEPAKAGAKPEAAAEAAPAAAAAPAAPSGGIKAWLPVIAALLLAPAATWATVEFVLVPRLQKKFAQGPAAGDEHAAEAAPAPAHSAPAAHGSSHGGKPGKEGKEA